MLKDITIGQYFPVGSFLHRMDPRVKLVLVLAVIVTVFVANNFAAMAVIVLATVALMLLSRVPLKIYFKSLKPIIPIIIITSVLNIFYIGGGETLLQFWVIRITDKGLITALFMSVRIICLILISGLLTYTTSPTELTDAIERLLSPLTKLKVDVHSLAMMMTIALRFIPTLVEETEKIMSAQKARGADMESGGLVQRMKALLPILIPLFVSSFRRAYELAYAMECRCYNGGEGRTRMKILKMSTADYLAVGIYLMFLAAIILLNTFC